MINHTILYSLISFLILIFFSKISYKLNLVDIPNEVKAVAPPPPKDQPWGFEVIRGGKRS